MLKAIKLSDIEGSNAHRLLVLAFISEDVETTYPLVLDESDKGYELMFERREEFEMFIRGYAKGISGTVMS